MKPKILVVISTPWTFRNIFCTPLHDLLEEEFQPCYCSFQPPMHDKIRASWPDAESYLLPWGGNLAPDLVRLQTAQSRCEAGFCPGDSRYLMLNYSEQRNRSRRRQLLRALGFKTLIPRPRATKSDLLNAMSAYRQRLLDEPIAAEYRQLIEDLNPDFIWLGTTCIPIDHLVHALASEQRRPTVTTILGWDNVSSKQLPPHLSDAYVVWGDSMVADLDFFFELHGQRPPVFKVGSPQFDIHAQFLQQPRPRPELARQYGLDAGRPIALYGACSPFVMVNEHKLVEQLLNATARRLPAVQWMVRLHPKDDGSRWAALRDHPGVVLHQPLRQKQFYDWLPDDDQVVEMVEQIGLADVVLTNTSTIVLDACVLQKPVIANRFEPEGDRVRRSEFLFRFQHMAQAVQTGAFPVCRSVAEICRELQAALENPAARAPQRAAFVRDVLGTLDGKTAERVVDALRQVACELTAAVA